MQPTLENAIRIIQERKGVIRTAEAIKAGIHPRTLYALRDQGIVELLSRGVYRLVELPAVSSPDLVTVALRVPKAVVCLVSALVFHEITTQVQHQVTIALEKGTRSPRLDFPPLAVYRFSSEAFAAGIEKHEIDGVTVRVYSREKTLADCFKFRNALGMDVVLEALKLYKQRSPFKVDALMKYADICRVKKIMQPYLESII